MKIKNSISILFLFIVITIFMYGCMPGGGESTAKDPAGFFMGVWHGWIAPISLIWSLFNPAIRVYETHNTGWWYDFGFYIAVISGFGGISLTRRKKKEKE